MKYYLLRALGIGFILSIFACSKIEYNGLNIMEVQFDQIVLQDGISIDLPESDSLKVFYLIRHAEKDTISKDDPGLLPTGIERAKRLENIFRKARIDKIYSTLYTRTIMTVQDVVYAKGMNIEPYDPRDLKGFAKLLFDNDEEKNFLIVGHSNTTPELFTLISGQECPVEISESDYSYFFVVILNGSKTLNTYYFKF